MAGVHGRQPDRRRLRRDRQEAQRGPGKLGGLFALLDEHGDEIEADLARYYQVDVCDFYRGRLSSRRLSVLIRQLPHDSATVTAINGGPVWGSTEHLLADVWALLLKANSDPKKTPDKLDHPVRAAMTAKAIAATKQQLKQRFLARKTAYAQDR